MKQAVIWTTVCTNFNSRILLNSYFAYNKNFYVRNCAFFNYYLQDSHYYKIPLSSYDFHR